MKNDSISSTIRAGLALSALTGLANLVFLLPSIDWGAEEPPLAMLLLAAAVGLVSVACAAIAWNSGNRRAIRINAAALIFNALMVVPGFFGDSPAWVPMVSAAFIVATVAAVILTMRREPAFVPVTD